MSLLSIALLMGIGYHVSGIVNDDRIRYDFDYPVSEPQLTREIGTFIQQNSSEADTIYCWGWYSWSVYFWANRRAPTRIYKQLGLLTDVNTNTAFRASPPMRILRGPLLDEFFSDVVSNPPRFFVFSTLYLEHNTLSMDLVDEFVELKDFLKTNYEAVSMLQDNLTGYVVLRRKD